MSQPVLLAIAAGVASALLYTGMLAMGPVLGALPWFLSPLPLLAAGLALGRGAALLAVAAGLLAFGGVTLSPAAALIYLASDGVPALLIVVLALRPAPGVTAPDPAQPAHWYPPGRILAWLALLPPVVMIVLAALAPAHVDGLQGLLRAEIGAGLEHLLAGSGQPAVLEGATREAVVESAVTFLPGAMALSWLFRVAVTAALAQAMLRRMGRSVRPSPAWLDLALPPWYGAVYAAVVLAALLMGGDAGYVAWSAAIGLSLPFLLLGFKLVHVVARRTPWPVPLLVAFYVVFLSVSAVAVVAMVLAGLVEFSTNLSRRAAGRASEEE